MSFSLHTHVLDLNKAHNMSWQVGLKGKGMFIPFSWSQIWLQNARDFFFLNDNR